jgi:hypothetical protein
MTTPGFDQLVSALVATGTERPNAERLVRRKLAELSTLDAAVLAIDSARNAATREVFAREAGRGNGEWSPIDGWSEHEHQVALIAWARENVARWPDLDLLFAIPNFHGRLGKLTARQGAYLRDEGRRRGVPDLCLPVARQWYHGLWIELKRIGGKPKSEQLEWRAKLRAQGYRAEIVEGWHAARDLIIRYLDG